MSQTDHRIEIVPPASCRRKLETELSARCRWHVGSWPERLPLFREFALLGVVVLGAALAGCRSGGKVNPQAAFLEGQQRAWTGAQMNQEPAVFFRGMVRNPRVTWREDLTLAQALLDAEYTGAVEPTRIRITRQGQSHTIDIRRLLRGKENPLLEPGDLIEVFR